MGTHDMTYPKVRVQSQALKCVQKYNREDVILLRAMSPTSSLLHRTKERVLQQIIINDQ